MTPRQILVYRDSKRFMPRLFSFAYPLHGRHFKQARRIAFKAWVFAFQVRVRLSDL